MVCEAGFKLIRRRRDQGLRGKRARVLANQETMTTIDHRPN